jgi:HAD superfamily hydrolase (TIGR01509 family)
MQSPDHDLPLPAQPELRALLFDFDGTIAETERYGHRVAYNRAFEELGLDWEWDEALYGELLSIAGGKERVRHYVERYGAGVPAGAGGVAELAERVHRVKAEHFGSLAPAIPLRPGIERVALEARAAGLTIAIVTTALQAGVEAVLDAHPPLAQAVGLIAAGDVVADKKPAPDIYFWALERLQLSAGECLAVEDSHNGLRAALAAGVPTVVTVSDYSAGEDFSGAAAVFGSLGDEGEPAAALHGAAPPRGLVDLAFLRAVHARAVAHPG